MYKLSKQKREKYNIVRLRGKERTGIFILKAHLLLHIKSLKDGENIGSYTYRKPSMPLRNHRENWKAIEAEISSCYRKGKEIFDKYSNANLAENS